MVIGIFPFLLEAHTDFVILHAKHGTQKNHFDLYLCVHTHGGQLSLVFPFIQLSPTLIETKYIQGDFWFGDMLMVVTRGLGMSLAPIRYNSTPEITLITLKSNKE